jgi:hypothetical protein
MADGETYLGDGCFVSFDGWQFRLRAPREFGDHEVFLEPGTLHSFEQFVKETRAQSQQATAWPSHSLEQAVQEAGPKTVF